MDATRDLIHWIDPICDDFEKAWLAHLRQEGPRPSPDAFIPSACPAAAELLRQLLEVDLEYCARIGAVSFLRSETFLQAMDSLSCRFEKGPLLGSGGMGNVHVALDLELRRRVALKEISDKWRHEPFIQQRFLREALVTGMLEHPNIVPIYGMVLGPGNAVHYAMRLLAGRTLAAEIDDLHRMPDDAQRGGRERELLRCFVTVCNAVAYAHAQGVIHRDLKPLNVIVDQFGQTYVIDWGLAKIAQESIRKEVDAAIIEIVGDRLDETTFGVFIGSRLYASPEQHDDSATVGPASDIYSLGATLLHLLTGQPPVPLSLGGEREAPPPMAMPLVMTRELRAICGRAMAADPQQRYLSPLALADDIERHLRDEPVSACPDPATTRLRRGLKRHVTTVVAASAAAIVALLGFILATGAIEQEQRAKAKAENDLVQSELRRSLEQANQKRLRAHEEKEWLASMDRQVSRTNFIYSRKDNPLLDWQNVVDGDARDLMPKIEIKAEDSGTSLEVLAEIAEMQILLAHMTGSISHWQQSQSIYEKAIPFMEKLIPLLKAHNQDKSRQHDVKFNPWMLPIAKNNYAVVLWRSGQKEKAVAAFHNNRDGSLSEANVVGRDAMDHNNRGGILSEANLGSALHGIDNTQAEKLLKIAYERQTMHVREGWSHPYPGLSKISLGIQYLLLFSKVTKRERAQVVLDELLADARRVGQKLNEQHMPFAWSNIFNHLRAAKEHLGKNKMDAFGAELLRAREINEKVRLLVDDMFDRESLLAQFWLLP